MCGIIGVTGAADALDVLLDGLERLEYRGYDSAGVALVNHGDVARWRIADGTHSVASLRSLTGSAPSAQAGLGHTRWATHGQPNDANAHPHLDCGGNLALVHNGIIENHAELAAGLIERGHVLTSVTDSEVLAHLIEELMETTGSLLTSVQQALLGVRGAFAIGVMSETEPELIVAARRISPLIVGRSQGASYLASDIPAILERTRDVVIVEDDQVVELRPGSIIVRDRDGHEVVPRSMHIDWDIEAAQKDGFDDFMTKEISEQPRAIADTLRGRISDEGSIVLDRFELSDERVRSTNKIVMVACGSSFHAALVAKYAFERWTRIPVEVDIASEFRYRDPVLDKQTLVIGVSQSGESVDTLQAVRHGADGGAATMVVTNVVDSTMAREADAVLYTRAGPEISVASTKTVLASIVALQLLGLHLARVRGSLDDAAFAAEIAALGSLEAMVADTIGRDEQTRAVANAVMDARDFFFLGRHAGYPTALEGALKLKEISYLHAEGYPGGELKHGPLAVIEPGCVVVALATGSPLKEKMLSNVAEVKSRGATVILVVDDGDEVAAALGDYCIFVPAAPELHAPVKDLVPLQQFAYHLARGRGFNVDRPRNLAKTVTVE
jgi:glucosamine--fructose-6-phosphate aminotransferase (isomerizing)